MTMGSRSAIQTEDAMAAFSALHLLRNYNQFFTPPGNRFIPSYGPYAVGASNLGEVHVQRDNSFSSDWPPVLGAFQPYLPGPAESKDNKYRRTSVSPVASSPDILNPHSGLVLTSALTTRRPRGEKKPIPDEQKDDRYYERRKRNNQAAKKSRDARKLREDQIALRAALLEHENAVLRAQIVTLRGETQSLRQLLFMQGKVQTVAFTASADEEYKLPRLNEGIGSADDKVD